MFSLPNRLAHIVRNRNRKSIKYKFCNSFLTKILTERLNFIKLIIDDDLNIFLNDYVNEQNCQD